MMEGFNRYTVGKQLRRAKNLRRKDPTATIVEPKQELADYIHHLKSQGLETASLAVAEFKTKNGLPYYGLIATELLKSNTVLIRVPVKCLLNTRVAFFSAVQGFIEENPRYFSKSLNSNWEDHILLAFLLHQFGRGQKSEWYHLIKNLPRDIDYVVFWDEAQIKALCDPVFEKMIKKERRRYERETNQFLTIAAKYPDLYPKQILTEENVRWIHIHLVTRCFGKYFQYTTMVPFAQLLNHECSDVYYTMFYEPDNPNNNGEEFYDEKQLTQEQMDNLDTSDGTYGSDEYSDPEDKFAFEEPKDQQTQNSKSEANGQDDAEQQNLKQREEVFRFIGEIENQLYNFFNFSDSVSLGYLREVFEGLETLRSKEVPLSVKRIESHRIQACNSIYLSAVKTFYSRLKLSYYTTVFPQKVSSGKKPPTQTDSEDQDITLPLADKGKEYFPREWPEEKFDQFLMVCSTKDQFQKGAQVFFCYGRISNRMMLMRYGMALEYNKYEHLYLHINVQPYLDGYSVFPKKLKQYTLKRSCIFKVKRTKFCYELLTFFRGIEFRLHDNVETYFYVRDYTKETRVVNRALELYASEMAKYDRSIEQHEAMLKDPKIGYHLHFAIIYKLQKQRVLQTQMVLLKIVLKVLQRLSNKVKLQNALLRVPELETMEQMRTYRLMMRDYFDRYYM